MFLQVRTQAHTHAFPTYRKVWILLESIQLVKSSHNSCKKVTTPSDTKMFWKRIKQPKVREESLCLFFKYVREVASGRRVTKLENILEFAVCASEEPRLGFALSPSIGFVEATCASREPSYNSDERAPQNQV
jgi:hypothetical protein